MNDPALFLETENTSTLKDQSLKFDTHMKPYFGRFYLIQAAQEHLASWGIRELKSSLKKGIETTRQKIQSL